MFVQDAAVPKMTVCVTFFALRCGATNLNICARSDYVTFSTMAATAVRQMTVCVAFGAPRLSFFCSDLATPSRLPDRRCFALTPISAFAVLNLHWISACGEFLCRKLW